MNRYSRAYAHAKRAGPKNGGDKTYPVRSADKGDGESNVGLLTNAEL